jgi:hypothetical protein
MKIFDLGLETSLSSSGASTAISKVARLNMIAKPASRSETLQKQLADAGARAFRVPFQESATHQDIVSRATNGIRACDSFVCLPGQTQSYVDHEVLAATISEKPVVFLISEQSGTLPNTADKRYPVFRLESTVTWQFEPLIEFLNYVSADFRSTWKLCMPSMHTCKFDAT